MDHQRDVQVLERGVQRIVVGIVERPSLDRIGADEDRLEAQLTHGAARLGHGGPDLLDRNDRNAQQSLRVGPAIVEEPIVVGAAEGRRVRLLFHRREIEAGGGKEQPGLDPLQIHVPEAGLGVHGPLPVRVGLPAVSPLAESRLVGLSMVAAPLEPKEELPVRDALDPRRALAKRRLKVPLPEVVGLSHVAVDVDDAHVFALPRSQRRSLSTSSTTALSTIRSRGS